jgi:hypothetical protein
MRVEESITINRSADEVFAFFDDRRNDSRWMGSVASGPRCKRRTGVGS